MYLNCNSIFVFKSANISLYSVHVYAGVDFREWVNSVFHRNTNLDYYKNRLANLIYLIYRRGLRLVQAALCCAY